MMLRTNMTPEKRALMDKVLPEVPLTNELIEKLLKSNQKILLNTLKKEIEIYKAFPKTNGKMDKHSFNPTNHKKCFMGQAFEVRNSGWEDADLRDYRKAIGTLHHGTWGNATLLEIWAGDHFDSHRDMVKATFSYCKGDRTTLPTLKFHVFPLFSNSKSGRWTLDDDDRDSYMKDYIIQLNGELANFGKKPMFELKGVYLEDFNKAWERRKRGLDI